MLLTKDEKGVLLLSARSAISTLFDNLSLPTIDYKIFPRLALKMGAFVTIRKENLLRGCIGYITSDMPLFNTVCNAAILAATEDPRFPPLLNTELSQIQLEISVLTPPVPVNDYNEIIIGKHGLIVDEPEGYGVLLPQVAEEYNLSIDNFLTALCEKAGLDPYLWREKKINLLSFSAEVFEEEKHKYLNDEKN